MIDAHSPPRSRRVEDWKKVDNPLLRLGNYLESQGWWSAVEEQALCTQQRKDVMDAFQRAERRKKSQLGEMMKDVWCGETAKQREELRSLLGKYGRA
ncbi:hypothetical protein CALVIDRAFT_568605 [Calocera viscosa TUFC12733]|uniref:2-oxoisovalerate dehydrogenase subunit alpha n=1 Tax=Calocera viscosa (strain TUFC12733) TaxID=1330018 RepID=A0A167GUP5_CALVF|nr:hypothetical protein CALVIDRAFT_568605 [Calocera viscosa TUFC12733]